MVEIGLVCVCGHKLLDFGVNTELDFVFPWVNFDSVQMWGVRIDSN